MEIRDHNRVARAQRAIASGKAVLSIDFDGVLSQLTADPGNAAANPKALAVLESVSLRLPIMVLSGRELSFLHKHLSQLPIWKCGLFGQQLMDPRGAVSIDPEVRALMPQVQQALTMVQGCLRKAGLLRHDVWVQDRDGLIVGIHYGRPVLTQLDRLREAQSTNPTPQRLAQIIGLEGFLDRARREIPRIVQEVAEACGLVSKVRANSAQLAAGEYNKGRGMQHAFHHLGESLSGVRTAIHIGDDERDIPAFEEIARLEREEGWTGLRVVVKSRFTTDEVLRHADVVLDGISEVPEFLVSLSRATELSRPADSGLTG